MYARNPSSIFRLAVLQLAASAVFTLFAPAVVAFSPPQTELMPNLHRTGACTGKIFRPPLVLSSSWDDDTESSDGNKDEPIASKIRRALLASTAAALTYNLVTLGPTLGLFTPPGYQRVSPIQFVAALGDPGASSGYGAEKWGLWPTDPGPRGLRLRDYEKIRSGGLEAPSWIDDEDFFLDENAIIMPQPKFPLPAGKYLVTGGRSVTAGLTVEPTGEWSLDSGKLYDVTHLPCRAARYRPNDGGGSPRTVRRADFPVAPGAVMPEVPGTDKQDYSVLFIIGKAAS